jgi:hypothetical protein
MVPHGAGVGVYVRGALSGLRPDARKSKHGLKTIFPNRLGRPSTVEPYGPTGGSLNRGALACLINSTEPTGGNGANVASRWTKIAPADCFSSSLVNPPIGSIDTIR